MDKTVGVNPFVERQTPESRFSYFDGTHGEVAELVRAALSGGDFRRAPWSPDSDDILYVTVPSAGFFSGVIKVQEGDVLRARFEARQRGEAATVGCEMLPNEKGEFDASKKVPAQYCEVLVYSHKVLVEDFEREKVEALAKGEEPKPLEAFVGTECDYEVVSENASPTTEATPATPVAMSRNVLGQTGGTKIDIDEMEAPALRKLILELCNGTIFWSEHVMTAEVK